MPQGTTIHFVTLPDGKVDQASINVYSEGHAKCGAIREWLPKHLFGDLRWLTATSYHMEEIWRGMVEMGWKVHSIDVPPKRT